MALLEVENLSYSYPSEKLLTLDNISFSVKENEFISVIGPSGCGKTTLALTLNNLIPRALGGAMKGNILVNGKDISSLSTAEISQTVQILFQSPDSQLFALNVEDEISFGLENLNLPWNEVKKRVDETLALLGIEDLRDCSIEELSSGQKQKVALASVIAMKPQILVLDEPTANLDPSSVLSFLNLIKKLKKEMSVILIEHNLDFVADFSDKIILMDKGKILKISSPQEMFKSKTFLKIMDAPSNKRHVLNELKSKSKIRKGKKLLEIKNFDFFYPNKKHALKNINLSVYEGDFLGIAGLNGSGKSTLALSVIGLLKSKKGHLFFNGRDICKDDVHKRAGYIGYVFQNPNYQLFEDNVFNEISFGLKNLGLAHEIDKRVNKALKIINLEEFSKEDPHSLSVGQKRRVTIASVVVMLPKLIIVDEPDTGLDSRNAETLMNYLKHLNDKGHAIILISHNLELVGKYCNRIVYIRNGALSDGF